MNKMMKKTIALVLALILCMGALTGCAKDFEKQVAVTINGQDLYMDEMMYYIYIEEELYGAYDELYQMMYGFSFWDSSTDGTTSMSTTVKHEIVSMAAWYTILNDKAVEAGITLDADTTAEVQETAQSMYDGLTDVQKEKTGLTVEGLVKVLTKIEMATAFYLQTVSGYEMDRDAIRATVSAEDYRQYEYEYYSVSFTSGDSENETSVSDDEKAALKESIDALKADVEAGKDMEELLGDNTDIHYSSSSFLHKDREDGGLNEAVSALKDGEVITYESEESYYLVRMMDNDSEAGYESEVRTQIQQAENVYFVEEYTEVAENCEIKPSRYWTKLQLGALTVDDTAAEDAE